jgi:molybdopterin/thiamine biosynthesis adenylyltransferase
VVPGVMGLLQATEAVKVLLGIGDPLVGRLLIYDALDASFQEVQMRRDPDCPACGTVAAAAVTDAPANTSQPLETSLP